MTVPVSPGTTPRLSPVTRFTALIAVGAARLLSRRPPRRIRRILSVAAFGARPANYAEAARARDTILSVSIRCCGPRACLPRSIAVALLCRLRGTWPTWCVGVVAVPPFTAHAWVEADGRPVDEVVEADGLRTLFAVVPQNPVG